MLIDYNNNKKKLKAFLYTLCISSDGQVFKTYSPKFEITCEKITWIFFHTAILIINYITDKKKWKLEYFI